MIHRLAVTILEELGEVQLDWIMGQDGKRVWLTEPLVLRPGRWAIEVAGLNGAQVVACLRIGE